MYNDNHNDIYDNKDQVDLDLSNVKSDDWSDSKKQLLTIGRLKSH